MNCKPCVFAVVAGSWAVAPILAEAQGLLRTDLVTDNQSAHSAQITDASLVNPWGMSYDPSGPFWVSDNGSAQSTVYSVNPANDATSKLGISPTIPGAGNVTGQAYHSGSGFNGDSYLFVNEDGTVSGWRPALGGLAEILQSPSANNVYKGAAEADLGGFSYLYAANFRTGAVDVLKGSSSAPNLTGNFTDPNTPAGFAPYNIQNLGGVLYVTFAKQDANQFDAVAGAGLGIVDAFDLNGNLLRRIGSNGGTLNAPWGLAIAPSSFGDVAGDLLVGNSGDGRIGVFDPNTSTFIRQLTNTTGNPLSIDGLWGLAPGNGGNGGSPNRLYFTAGPDNGTHGLFGSLTPVPEPTTIVALCLGGLVFLIKRKSRR